MQSVAGGIFLGVLSGIFIGIICIFGQENKTTFQKVIMTLISVVICSIIWIFSFNMSNSAFNNGYCIECGTKYEAVTRNNNQTYYECPNCHFGCWY